jgi:FRG domain-containing protein
MEEFTVSTYSEYVAATEQIYGEYTATETLIVLRGQTAEYRLPDGRLAIVPSGFRTAHPGVPKGLERALSSYFEAYLRTADELTRTLFERDFSGSFETFIDDYQLNWGGPSGRYHASELTDLPSIYAAFTNPRFAAAVAQHYGAPTGMLDVTTDPDVALWFAAHRYCHGGQGRPVHYESARDPGYVYVLRDAADHVVPLSTFLFDWNTRPRRQQAAALFGLYDLPPDGLLERVLQFTPRCAVPQRPAGNTFADLVIARIEIGKAVSSRVAGWTATHLFPCPGEDALYAHLLKNCSWVEEFVHCGASPEPSASSIATSTFRTRPVKANRELASDPSWFTVLLLGDDAHAAHEYAWRFSYAGSILGVVNLFDKQGLNLIAVTVDEAKELILESGVAAIFFCDVGRALIRDGIADDVCQRIAQSGKVVIPAYTNLDEHERRFSEAAFRILDPVNELSEGQKITMCIRSAIEMSWQLRRAAPSSICRKQFSDGLRVLFR